jgi:hypothetical protein
MRQNEEETNPFENLEMDLNIECEKLLSPAVASKDDQAILAGVQKPRLSARNETNV